MTEKEIRKLAIENQRMKHEIKQMRQQLVYYQTRYVPDCQSCKYDETRGYDGVFQACEKCCGNDEHQNHYSPVGHGEQGDENDDTIYDTP